MRSIAFITGASSGIGEATAKILAINGYDIIITGRRSDRLNSLKDTLESQYHCAIMTLQFDIRIETDVKQAIETLPEEWKNIDLLINNAGLSAGLDPIHQGDTEDWDQMIDTNVKGLLYVTRIVSALMVNRKKGQIVNISSIAGKEIYPNGNVYCASKHAVAALTRAMRLDLHQYGIKVGSISPGMVETEFSLVRFHGDENRAKNVYQGFTPMNAQDIAEAILFMVSRPSHVNIDDIFITATAQGSSRDTFRN